jgi:hypothetical protein
MQWVGSREPDRDNILICLRSVAGLATDDIPGISLRVSPYYAKIILIA